MKKLTNISKVLLLLILAVIFSLSMAGWAGADIVTMGLNTTYSGTSPAGSAPWITATFTDAGTNNVQLTLSAGNLTGSEFISGWYFNLNTSLDPSNLAFTAVNTSDVGTTSITQGTDCCKPDGDGKFDFVFSFPTAGGSGRFNAGESVVYNISSTGLSAASFNTYNTPKDSNPFFTSAAHIQSINGIDGDGTSADPGSGWIASTTATVVPEPVSSTLFIIGSALLGIKVYRNKRIKV